MSRRLVSELALNRSCVVRPLKLTLFSCDLLFKRWCKAFSISESFDDRSEDEQSSVMLDIEECLERREEAVLLLVDGFEEVTLER